MRNKLKKVVVTTTVLDFCGFTLIASIVWNVVDHDEMKDLLIFFYLVHFCEAAGTATLLWYDFKSAAPKNKKKVRPRATTTSSAASSSASEAESTSNSSVEGGSSLGKSTCRSSSGSSLESSMASAA